MKNQLNAPGVETKKIISITVLFAASIVIMILGASLSIFSILNDISFRVMNYDVSGAIFGVIITFLGLRYFISVLKLRAKVYQTTSKFSWSNFKRRN